MKKRVVSILMAAIFLLPSIALGATSARAATEYIDGNYMYTLSNGQATIIGCSNPLSGAVVIPETLGGYPVTAIGGWAFTTNCSNMTSVTLPAGITTIGNYAFHECANLASVSIPDSVTQIGERAFSRCRSLTSVVIPDSVTEMGTYVFRECSSLAAVTIGKRVTALSYDTFLGCNALSSITVEAGNPIYHSDGNCLIKTADKELVVGCQTSVIPSDGSVTTIGDRAFSACGCPVTLVIPDSVTAIESEVFYDCKALNSVIIGSGVTAISDYTFFRCTGLTSATLGEKVTSVGNYAFFGCSALTSVTIGDGMASLGNYAFYNCTNLTDVYYVGTEEQWSALAPGTGNDTLAAATIHHNYLPPIPGDVDGNRVIDCGDAVYLLYHTMLPEQYPLAQSGDSNGDGQVNSEDAIYLLYHVLLPALYPIV